MTDAASTIEAAKPSVGLIDKGDFGIVIYALLFVIGLLLLRDLARDWILRGVIGKLGSGLASINVQLSRLESTVTARQHHDED